MDLEAVTTWAPTILLVTGRVAGMVLLAPVFGSPAVPVKVRLIVSAAMALGVVSRLAGPVASPGGAAELAVGLGGEVAIGVAIGFAARVIFTGVELGALHVGSQVGLGLAGAVNPVSADTPTSVRGLFGMLAAVVFLAVGGHRALIAGLLGTFELLPPLGFSPDGGLLDVVTGCLAASFVLALRVAAPVLVALLLATVALGLLHRAVPQCNVLTVGLPVRVLLGLTALAASLAAIAPLMEDAAGQLGKSIRDLAAAAG